MTLYHFNKKQVGLFSATLGLSMAMTTVATAATVGGSEALKADELASITAFLATQPKNKDTKNLGETESDANTINYTFPGVDNYTPAYLTKYASVIDFAERSETFSVLNSETQTRRDAKIKNPDSVTFYRSNSNYYTWAKNVTVIYTDDQSEEVIPFITIRSDDNTIYSNHFIADLAIEANDPRFKLEQDNSWALYFNNLGYWGIEIPISTELPYETIIEIDESLKSGEYAVDQEGSHGTQSTLFRLYLKYDDTYNFGDSTDSGYINRLNYRDYNADFLYNTALEILANNDVNAGDQFDYDWGSIGTISDSSSESTNRLIRVGIDYTHHVDTDGKVLSPTEYGLQKEQSITNYKVLEVRSETNGDRTYVYEKVKPTAISDKTTDKSPKKNKEKNLPQTGSSTNNWHILGLGAFISGTFSYLRQVKKINDNRYDKKTTA